MSQLSRSPALAIVPAPDAGGSIQQRTYKLLREMIGHIREADTRWMLRFDIVRRMKQPPLPAYLTQIAQPTTMTTRDSPARKDGLPCVCRAVAALFPRFVSALIPLCFR